MLNPFWPSYEREKGLFTEEEAASQDEELSVTHPEKTVSTSLVQLLSNDVEFRMPRAHEKVVAAVMEYIGETWKPMLEMSIRENLPDYERVRRPDHYWRGSGPQPEDFVEFDTPDAPLNDSNSDLIPNLFMKRALIEEKVSETSSRLWLWDSTGLNTLDRKAKEQIGKEWGFLYWYYWFEITSDLKKVWFANSPHPRDLRKYQFRLAVQRKKGQLVLVFDKNP